MKILIKIISLIPFLLSFKTISMINGWYFYIPVVWIMFINWISFTKIWMGVFTKEDFSVWVKTSGVLIIFLIISAVVHYA